MGEKRTDIVEEMGLLYTSSLGTILSSLNGINELQRTISGSGVITFSAYWTLDTCAKDLTYLTFK